MGVARVRCAPGAVLWALALVMFEIAAKTAIAGLGWNTSNRLPLPSLWSTWPMKETAQAPSRPAATLLRARFTVCSRPQAPPAFRIAGHCKGVWRYTFGFNEAVQQDPRKDEAHTSRTVRAKRPALFDSAAPDLAPGNVKSPDTKWHRRRAADLESTLLDAQAGPVPPPRALVMRAGAVPLTAFGRSLSPTSKRRWLR